MASPYGNGTPPGAIRVAWPSSLSRRPVACSMEEKANWEVDTSFTELSNTTTPRPKPGRVDVETVRYRPLGLSNGASVMSHYWHTRGTKPFFPTSDCAAELAKACTSSCVKLCTLQSPTL